MAKSILGRKVAVLKSTEDRDTTVAVVLPKNELTDKVTRQYCELNLMGEWFADDPKDAESLGSCYH